MTKTELSIVRPSPLRLNKQSIKVLAASDLGRAGGGITDWTHSSNFNFHCVAR
jgi:hypothetical protein